MFQPRTVDTSGGRPPVSVRSHARAAGVANLLVGTLTLVEFTGLALVNHDMPTFVTGLRLVPLLTVAVWAAATLLFLAAAVAVRGVERRASRDTGWPLPGGPGVWDRWLDSPWSSRG